MDWNGDGLDDIILGDRNGHVRYFRRTGNGINDLTYEGVLFAAGDSIEVINNSAPLVVDWNNDGLLDLVLGSLSQTLRLYLNSGTVTNPVFTGWTEIKSEGSAIDRHACNPNICDLNNDGKKDLLIGCHPSNRARVYYYENTGTDVAPVFGKRQEILNPAGNPVFIGSYLKVVASDWNGDGIPDLVAGNGSGKAYVSYAINTAITENLSALSLPAFDITAVVNPAQNSFVMRLDHSSHTVRVVVYDSSGRIVSTSVVSTDDKLFEIDATRFSAGVYTVVAFDGDNISSCKMLLMK